MAKKKKKDEEVEEVAAQEGEGVQAEYHAEPGSDCASDYEKHPKFDKFKNITGEKIND